jgi:hypothetical protein
LLDIPRQAPRALARPYLLGFPVPKILNHGRNITPTAI